MRRVIYPGTFDPVTHGHLDMIERAASLFNEVLVAIGDNPAKRPLFTAEERLAMLEQETADHANVTVLTFSGLLTDFARQEKCDGVIRGIRTVSDFEYELQMALMNRSMSGLETLFLTHSPDYQFLNSQLIREVASLGGDLGKLVTPGVARALRAKFPTSSKADPGRGRTP